MDGNPLIIPPRYRQLWDAIFLRDHNRVNVKAPTQDGKSLTIASAVSLVASTQPEKFTILAPSEKKADIIMAYVRDFVTQHKVCSSGLQLDRNDTLDRLKRERSKKHITFKGGGGVQILTLDARNGKKCMEAAMGFGSKNIIEDEAGLIPDTLHSTVMRMMGGYSYDDTFLLKIGNPFYRNHFLKSSNNPDYLQIGHNYKESIADKKAGYHGFDERFIEEMRSEAFWDVYYECLFPNEDEIDEMGFRQLLLSSEIKQGTIIAPTGTPRLGCDIGGGGDFSVYVLRWGNYAKVIKKLKTKDTMTNVVEIAKIIDSGIVKASDVFIDDIGVGRGVTDRLREKNYSVTGVNVGMAARQKNKFSNLKAEINWLCGQWIKQGNLLEPDPDWVQCVQIKYKVNTDKVIKMESKQELKKRINRSPDTWDALALTFKQKPLVGVITL